MEISKNILYILVEGKEWSFRCDSLLAESRYPVRT